MKERSPTFKFNNFIFIFLLFVLEENVDRFNADHNVETWIKYVWFEMCSAESAVISHGII